MNEVYIVASKRTPIGSFFGALSEISAPELGATAIKAAYNSINLNVKQIGAVYLGNVLSANVGQSPARQAAILAGIPDDVDCTTINKVCASGMKATMIGVQQIQLGIEDIVLTGGMESMSNVPHYSLPRKGKKLGDLTLIDGLLKDGLTDAYNGFHMGNAAELCVNKFNISRERQDEYAVHSYEKALNATITSKFQTEIAPVTIQTKAGPRIITEDEDIHSLIPEKVSQLLPVFDPEGTITAANASSINDGAAAIILASKDAIEKHGFKPLARIIAYSDGAQAPEWYTTAPSIAISEALKIAKLSITDIDFFEINEAYAAVVLANSKLSNIDLTKVNIYGGAVALGHPLGASGTRIICTLLSALTQENGKYGLAAICNGGGGSSAIIIERL